MRSLNFLPFLLALIFFPVSGFCKNNPQEELPDKENFHLFLLAGQSNMAGRGQITAEDKKIHPRILALSKDGKWLPAVDPIHYDKPMAGVGLGKSFAEYLAERNKNIVIGLVPAACGGSPISTWLPGGFHDQTDSHPYDDAVQRMRRAMKDGVLKGILWHQGESDSTPILAPQYRNRLQSLIERFRKDLNAPEVPFIIGQLGQFPSKPWSESRKLVNDAQESLANDMPFVGFTSSAGLTPKKDIVHFNSNSLRIFGKRYAAVFLKIMESAPMLAKASQVAVAPDNASFEVVPATASCISYVGRTCEERRKVILSFPGTEIRIRFRGPSLELRGEVLSGENWFNLRVDGVPRPRIDVPSGKFSVKLAEDLKPDDVHEVRLLRRNEAWQGTIQLDSFSLPEGGHFMDKVPSRARRILCIGDSITGGEKTEFIPPYAPSGNSTANAELSYGWQLAALLDADVHLVSYGGKGVVRDWQGKTNEVTAIEFFELAHSNRPSPLWDHTRYQPQLVIICLGTNDYSTGMVDQESYVKAYIKLVERVHSVHPNARVLLLSSPMLAGYAPDKSDDLLEVLNKVQASFDKKDLYFVKVFEIGKYAGTIWNGHPSGPQHREMAEKLFPVVSNWLGWTSVP